MKLSDFFYLFLALALCPGFICFLWTRTGRFKWFTVGLAAAFAATIWHSEWNWIVITVGILIVAMRDEGIRARLAEQARYEARKDFVGRPWGPIYNREKYEPQELDEPQERIMDHLTRRILERL